MIKIYSSALYCRVPLGYVLSVVGLIFIAGCHGSATSDSSAASKADRSAYTVIQRGRPPISTMVTATGQVEVADLTADKVVLQKRDIAPNTLITMNPGSLTFNMKQVSDGPFDRHHTYEFRLYR